MTLSQLHKYVKNAVNEELKGVGNNMATIHKISGYLLDVNNEWDEDEIIYLLENHDLCDKFLTVKSVKVKDWDDYHPLNYINCDKSECDKYFADDKDAGDINSKSKQMFDILGVKPNEQFMIEGSQCKYRIDEELNLYGINEYKTPISMSVLELIRNNTKIIKLS